MGHTSIILIVRTIPYLQSTWILIPNVVSNAPNANFKNNILNKVQIQSKTMFFGSIEKNFFFWRICHGIRNSKHKPAAVRHLLADRRANNLFEHAENLNNRKHTQLTRKKDSVTRCSPNQCKKSNQIFYTFIDFSIKLKEIMRLMPLELGAR